MKRKLNPNHRRSLGMASAAAVLCAFAWSGAVSAGSEAGAAADAGSDKHGMQQSGAAAGDRNMAGEGVAKRLPDNYKLSNWIGKPVENDDGDKLGKVEDLVMDDFGRVRFVIMDSQTQGDGDRQNKLVAVPIGHFQYPLTQDQHLTLNASPTRMQGAPSFDRAEYPNMGQESLSTVIIAYWLPEDAQIQGQDEGRQMGQDQGPKQGQGQQLGAAQPGAGADRQPGQAQGQGQAQSGQAGQTAMEPRFDPNRDMVYLPPEKTRLFNSLDQDSSDTIERSEAGANEQVSRQFDEIDTYGNNRITRSEFAAFELDEGQSAQTTGAQDRGQQGQGTPMPGM